MRNPGRALDARPCAYADLDPTEIFGFTHVGFLKGKTALYVANKYARKRRYKGYHFWARGYFVSTTGYNEQVVRRYIRNQEKADKASDFADLFNTSY
jgi:putative transposase